RQCFLISIVVSWRPMKAGSLRRLVRLVLVASLLGPRLGVTEAPTTSQQPQPPARIILSPPTAPPAPSRPRRGTPRRRDSPARGQAQHPARATQRSASDRPAGLPAAR